MTLIAGKQPFTGTEQAAPGNLRLSNELYVNDNSGNVRKKEAVVAWTCRQKANGRPRDHVYNTYSKQEEGNETAHAAFSACHSPLDS